jgi:hypothetical protein
MTQLKVKVKVRSECYFTTGDLPLISSSWRQAPWDSRSVVLYQLKTCSHSPYVTSSLSVVYNFCCPSLAQSFSGPIPTGLVTIFYCLKFETLHLEDQVPTFLSLGNRVAQLYPQSLCSLFAASYDSQVYGAGIRHRLHTGKSEISFTIGSYIAPARTEQKTSLPLSCYLSLPGKETCPQCCSLATAVVLSLVYKAVIWVCLHVTI